MLLFKDQVLVVLKTIQRTTRSLQHICGHSKVARDVQLISYIPLLKRNLETLLFQVKVSLFFLSIRRRLL